MFQITEFGSSGVRRMRPDEAAYLIGSRGGAEAEALFLDALAPGGRFGVAELDRDQDLPRMAELIRAYANLPLGTVDAAVVAIAVRLGLDTIATVDRRDFGIDRPRHIPVFTSSTCRNTTGRGCAARTGQWGDFVNLDIASVWLTSPSSELDPTPSGSNDSTGSLPSSSPSSVGSWEEARPRLATRLVMTAYQIRARR